MAFYENLHYLRKRDKITQEALADWLGVSRQSVSKWETGEAYPETDKLILLCDKFNVSLDDMLRGDVRKPEEIKDSENAENVENIETEHTEKNENCTITPHIYPDEYGFARHMEKFARCIGAGVFVLIFGAAICVALCGVSDYYLGTKAAIYSSAFAVAEMLAAITVAVFLFVYSGMTHERFKLAHPEIPNIYTRQEVEKFLKRFPLFIASAISAILLGTVMLVVLSTLIDGGIVGGGVNANYYYVTAGFLAVVSVSVGAISYLGITRTKFVTAEYNLQTKKELSRRGKLADSICGAIMMTCAAIYLIMGFIWNLWHPGWVIFPVGGIICGIVSTVYDAIRKNDSCDKPEEKDQSEKKDD